MAGIKGMKAARPRPNTARARIWQSIRIMRRFTIPDLCRTANAGRWNVKKFVQGLERHGYIAGQKGFCPGRPGVHKVWRLINDTGPEHPLHCDQCGRPVGEKGDCK